MPYAINHVHIRSSDPKASAAWYEKFFDANILWAREVMPGTVTVSMEVGGPVRLNISSKPDGSSDKRSSAELNQLGLEHFGFDVEDLESELKRLEDAGVRVVLPLTKVPTGSCLAYIEGPDDVLIELVQPAQRVCSCNRARSHNRLNTIYSPITCWRTQKRSISRAFSSIIRRRPRGRRLVLAFYEMKSRSRSFWTVGTSS